MSMTTHQALNKLEIKQRQAPLAEQYYAEQGNGFILRSVDPSRDLELFLAWMEDPDLRVNGSFRENRGRLDKHYELFLESENRQSFLVEKFNQVLFQFDIFLIHFHELYYRIPTTTGDCIMNYIILFKEGRGELLKNALTLQLNYFFYSPNAGGCGYRFLNNSRS